MIPDEPSDMPVGAAGDQEQFELLLLALDEQLAAGSTCEMADLSSVSSECAARLRAAHDCLSLLQAAVRTGQLDDLARGNNTVTGPAPKGVSPSDQIGRFHIVDELGRGGYGVVFRAIDPALGRQVALKVPRPEALVTPKLRRRFLREAKAAGNLHHENLVAVYEVGEDGPLVYLVTEYCDGPNLSQKLREATPGMSHHEAAQLVAAIADGVEYAHRRGILHRDIKPSNVLLASISVAGEMATPKAAYVPKLADFGLAKLDDGPVDHTHSGALVGTPAYMAPEQADGRVHLISARTDVYGLGTVLYEALTGQAPFSGGTPLDTARLVLSDDPVSPRRLSAGVPADLEAICLKCLQKDPGQRYASAGELASDLRRYLRGEPTWARPLRWYHRATRWARRRPLVAALLGVIFASALCLVAVIGVYTARLGTALAESDQRRNEAEHQQEAAQTSQRRATQSQTETRRLLYAADIKLADEAFRSGYPSEAVDRLIRYLPSSSEPNAEDLREFAWRYLWHRCHDRLLTLRGHSGPVFCVEYSPGGAWVATAGQDGTIRLWEATSGRPIRTLEGHHGDVNCVSISPDGRWLASAGADGTVRIWDVASGREIRSLLDNAGEIFAVQFSSTGGLLAAAGKDGLVRLWRTGQWNLAGTLEGHTDLVESLDFAPDEKTLASAGRDSVVFLWDLGQFKPRAKLPAHCGAVYAVRFSPAGGLLAAAGQDGQWILWNATTATELRRSWAHAARVTSLNFSPDGARLLTASRDRSARLWDVASGQLEARFDGHTERLWHVVFSPDGTSFATASSDGTAKLCKLSDACEVLPQYYVDRGQIAIDEKGELHAASRDRADACALAIYDGRARHDWRPSAESKSPFLMVGLDTSGSAAAAFGAGEVFFWTRESSWNRVLSGVPISELWPPPLSPGGNLLAIGIEQLQVFETRHWQPVLTARLPGPPAWVQFSNDGTRLVASFLDGRVALWSIADGPQPKMLPVSLTGPVIRACFSPDDRQLALAGDDGRVRVVESANGRMLYDLASHAGGNISLAFSSDGINLAITDTDRVLRVWDLRTGRNLLDLDQIPEHLSTMIFAPNGEELFGCLAEGRVVRWTAPRAARVERRAEPVDPSVAPAVPAGQRNANGETVRALPLGAPRQIESLQRVFQRFAALPEVRQRIVRPTFDDRENDQGLLLGALALSGARHVQEPYSGVANDDQWIALARDADDHARRAHHTAGYPLLYERRVGSLALLEPGSFERRDVPLTELGDVDTDRDRFREIHRWAKSHGFAGGFPTFVDIQNDGRTAYGAVLIKAGFGEEVFLPATSVWPVVVPSQP